MSFKGSLQAKNLYQAVRKSFDNTPELHLSSHKGIKISTTDGLLSAIAMFSLKFRSLLQFDIKRREPIILRNLKSLYGIKKIPSDTRMREMLDDVAPEDITVAFKELFRIAQRAKILERFVFLDGHYLVSLDGTGHFSSNCVYCDNCCKKHHRDGSVTYYHQMLGAVIVHPDEKVVIPFAPEAIIKEDGQKKNDCERNAAKRLIPKIRKDHPRLPMIVLEDGLASNAPHIKLLQKYNMRFILGAKEADHVWLYDWIKSSDEVRELKYKSGKITVTLRYLNNVELNASNPDIKVNFLECIEEEKGEQIKRFGWVTDLELRDDNVKTIAKGGRARWKIENETFNTLKNQGYQFEHNFGHGIKNLSTILACMMFIAFMIDQLLQTAYKKFKAALKHVRNNKRAFWDKLRGAFAWVCLESWDYLFDLIAEKIFPQAPPEAIYQDSS